MVTKKRKAKRRVHKKILKHKRAKKITERASPKDIHIERILIDNFVSLQKVMTNLSIKFDSLTTQISKLLELFEISAKSLAEKNIETIKTQGETKEILKKMDNLLDQNKIIARGLTLMHEKIPAIEKEEETFESELLTPPDSFESTIPQPIKSSGIPQPKKPSFSSTKDAGFEGYQKSIADI